MSFHSMPSREERERARLPHPVWRGVGVVMIILIPIVSFALSDYLIRYMNERVEGFLLPYVLRRSVEIPGLGEVENFFGVLAFTAVVSLALFAIFSTINALIYRVMRDRTLRVFESEPERFKKKKKTKKPKYKR